MPCRPIVQFAVVALLVACTPALNWRESRPAGSGAVALFPCKPEVEQRGTMGLAQCEAAGHRFSLSWAEVPEPTQAGAALKAMAQALAAKLKQPLPGAAPLQVPGATPWPEAGQYRLDGSSGVSRLAVFAHGSRVYQALVSGASEDAGAWDAFVGGLRVEPAR
ncbi:hypothetical protein [Pelomonas cellulosilytica]|uniref:Lipoprotein n=1 Tax=Pelomonas cellulosilytica TaxID=2906762 RepID=A0ABS8Y4M0_9BURK|nr:hypothetical protein [Pelomonas sp. P8]MCE4558209.1 hypothetical protein [Pelomonas sp. P8]